MPSGRVSWPVCVPTMFHSSQNASPGSESEADHQAFIDEVRGWRVEFLTGGLATTEEVESTVTRARHDLELARHHLMRLRSRRAALRSIQCLTTFAVRDHHEVVR